MEINKQVTLCTLGSIIEWYEFTVFGSLTPILSILFFPKYNHITAMIATFGIFASGYVTRPLGAIFFGHLGDTLGRKYSLLITIFLMATATMAIGCIPVGSYFSILALVLCRLVQGLATSGVYPGSLALLAEMVTQKHRGFVTSFGIFGSSMGCAVGAIVYMLLLKCIGYDAMLAWGWRIPFLLALPFGLISFWLRRSIVESSEFQKIQTAGLLSQKPLIELFANYSKVLLAALAISILTNTGICINLIYIGNYSISTHKLNANQMASGYLMVSLVYSITILLCGFFSDYINKKRMMLIGCSLLLVSIYPFFKMILGPSVALQFFAQAALTWLTAMVLVPFVYELAQMFPVAIRYSGLSVVLNVAASFFGGTAPMVCAWLTSVSGSAFAPGYYLMSITALALIAMIYLFLPKRISSTNQFAVT